MNKLNSRPSDSDDPRYALPRSPHCPNDAPVKVVEQGIAGTCGHCAWGFYNMDDKGHQPGEDASTLDLIPIVDEGGAQMGYKARCGKVNICKDEDGRVGALRRIDGEDRFFPGIKGNWAYERYLERHPALVQTSAG